MTGPRNGFTEQFGNTTTRNCIYLLDTTRDSPQNQRNFSNSFLVQGAGMEKFGRRLSGCGLYLEPAGIRGRSVQYLPGWTVQCINPECEARGHWLRAIDSGGEFCSNCNSPLHNVPPPLAPRLRMRPRSLGSYRPMRRPPGRSAVGSLVGQIGPARRSSRKRAKAGRPRKTRFVSSTSLIFLG